MASIYMAKKHIAKKHKENNTLKVTDDNKSDMCNLCGSNHHLTFHHLIPRCCHNNKWFRKNFTLDDMRTRGVVLCRKCHSFIHKQFSEKALGRELNSLEALAKNEVIAKYVVWAKKRLPRVKD